MSLLVVLMNGLAAFFVRERTPARVLASPVTWTIAAGSFEDDPRSVGRNPGLAAAGARPLTR